MAILRCFKTDSLNSISTNLGGNNLVYQDGNFYIENRGADTGLKKLGDGYDYLYCIWYDFRAQNEAYYHVLKDSTEEQSVSIVRTFNFTSNETYEDEIIKILYNSNTITLTLKKAGNVKTNSYALYELNAGEQLTINTAYANSPIIITVD